MVLKVWDGGGGHLESRYWNFAGNVSGVNGVGHPELVRSLTCVPNPSYGTSQAVAEIVSAGEYELKVYDVCGREVSGSGLVRLAPGTHRIPLYGGKQRPGGLVGGKYFVRLYRQNVAVATSSVAILR